MVDLVSISIYSNNQRVKLTPDSTGKFLVPNDKKSGYPPLHKVTAVGLINHSKIKYMDPVLALSDGSKLRVYQGGDPSSVLTMAISLCEKHDNKNKKKYTKPTKRRKIFTSVSKPKIDSYVCGDPDLDGYDYPWCDPTLYDDSD